jgi:hypothetical protein
MAIEIDATLYITDVRQITIERVPNKGLVRVKIKGKDTGFCDEMSLTVWGLKLVSGEAPEMPEIIDTTVAEPPAILVVEREDEDADI